MRKHRDLLGALGEKMDIPREALPGGYALAMSGERELTLWGCTRILSYGEQEVVLRMGRRTLRIGGMGLLCSAFGAGSVTVTGEIRTLCFEVSEK